MTKRLVAHRPPSARPHDRDEPAGYGPADGDPVWLTVPCARLAAGYPCPCGTEFEYREYAQGGWWLARVEASPDGVATGYRWLPHVLGSDHGRMPPDANAALAAQIEALPIGAVVERHGIGIAPRFEPEEVRRAPEWAFLDEPEPYSTGYPF